MTEESANARPTTETILYLLTDEISSVLVRGQLGHLADHGFDVTVATRLHSPDHVPEPGRWDEEVRVEHLPFVREPSPLADLRALWSTIRLIRRLRPTIVNASTPKAGLLGMLAAWVCRVPVRVYVVRGFRFETVSGWARRLLVSLELVATRCATTVVFNSASLMAVGEQARVIRAGRGHVLGAGSGNGIDTTRFDDRQLPSRAVARETLGLEPETTVIGFVGRFTRDKGIEDIVEVFTRLSAEAGPDDGAVLGLRLLLVGQFEQGDPVRERTRAIIAADPHIVVVPWLDDTGLAYRAMDLLVFPSYREGLPNVPLEAQLCGVPIVGYAATGTVDAVADGIGGRLVAVGDTAALRIVVQSALSDASGRARNETAAADRAAGWVRARFARPQVWAQLRLLYSTAVR